MMEDWTSENCAVIERTGDGVVVGRCWYFVGESMICPRHGNVSSVQKRFKETGLLTDEATLPPPPQEDDER